MLLRAVDKQRDRCDERRVKTFGRGIGKGGIEVESVKMVEPRWSQNVRDGHGAPPPLLCLRQEPFCVDVEEQDEEDHTEQRNYGNKHDIAVIGEYPTDDMGQWVRWIGGSLWRVRRAEHFEGAENGGSLCMCAYMKDFVAER